MLAFAFFESPKHLFTGRNKEIVGKEGKVHFVRIEVPF